MRHSMLSSTHVGYMYRIRKHSELFYQEFSPERYIIRDALSKLDDRQILEHKLQSRCVWKCMPARKALVEIQEENNNYLFKTIYSQKVKPRGLLLVNYLNEEISKFRRKLIQIYGLITN